MEEVRKNVCFSGLANGFKPLASACLTLAVLPCSVFAANGTWSSTASGNWPDTPNWVGGTFAGGSGSTAFFNQVDVPATNITVSLGGNRTIGNLNFGDTDTSSAGNWFVQNNILTLAGASPTVTVNSLGSGKFARINSTLAGTDGLTKNGSGLLILGAANTIEGPITVSSGILQLNVAALSDPDADVSINGGSLVVATTAANALGGTITFGGGLLQYNNNPGTDYSPLFSTAASQNYRLSATGSISATLASPLTSSGGTLSKEGTGTITLGGLNTYTGNTTVSAGTLVLADDAQLRFNIGASGVNNKITGTGTLTLDGDFNFDLTGAATLGTWNIVDVGALAETFNSTFSVVGFTDAGGNLWTKTSGGATYTFNEADGTLTAVPEPATLGAAVLLAGVTSLRRRRTVLN